MTVTDDVSPRPSVPPPGWRAGGTGLLVPPAGAERVRQAAAAGAPARVARAGAFSPAADAAVRWRIGAAAVDYLLSVLAYGGLCLLRGWTVWLPAHLAVFLVLHLGYHFLWEYRTGQTIGKRRAGVRVVALDGGPPSARAIAIRSLLRLIDSLPTWYASGLLNMLRTGPARRQRIGDVVAGTLVVAVDGRAAARGTPRWYLPLVTLIAVGLSVPAVLTAVRGQGTPMTQGQQEQFVAACSAGEPAAMCKCVLAHLEADGYTSVDKLRVLFARSAQATAAGRPDLTPPPLLRGVAACRSAGATESPGVVPPGAQPIS